MPFYRFLTGRRPPTVPAYIDHARDSLKTALLPQLLPDLRVPAVGINGFNWNRARQPQTIDPHFSTQPRGETCLSSTSGVQKSRIPNEPNIMRVSPYPQKGVLHPQMSRSEPLDSDVTLGLTMEKENTW